MRDLACGGEKGVTPIFLELVPEEESRRQGIYGALVNRFFRYSRRKDFQTLRRIPGTPRLSQGRRSSSCASSPISPRRGKTRFFCTAASFGARRICRR